MPDPWWSSVRRWTGEFRNQQRCRSPALEVLIVGQFDLSATRTPGVWSGVLAGELQRYRYVGDEGAWEGSGAFKIPVDFSLDETGYRLDFKGEGMSYAGTAAKIAGTFQHRPKGGQPEVQSQITLDIEDTWCNFFEQRIPSVPEYPAVISCVVQVPGGKGDNHREHWILAPEGCGGLLFPRPLPDGNLRPPFDDPKFEERPPYLAEVMKPKPPPDEGQAKPAPGGGQAKPSKPEPAPPASPPRGRAAMRAASVTRKESGTAPEALATHAYLLEDDSVEARVVHFTLGCPALKSASLEPAAVALGGLKLVDDAASMEAFGRPACGTCKRMMAAGPAREIGRFSDAKAELVIYDDRIASFDRGQDEDSLPVAVRLADVESFTISGFFAARALFITVDGDHLFEFNPEDKQELEAARNALLEVEIPERSSWF